MGRPEPLAPSQVSAGFSSCTPQDSPPAPPRIFLLLAVLAVPGSPSTACLRCLENLYLRQPYPHL